MASATLKVPEKTARRLLKELNYSDSAKATPKKLVKYLREVKEGLNGDSVEDMDISNPCKSLMEEVVEAIDDEKQLQIVSADDEEEEEEEEEEATPKKKAKGTKVKTQVKTKTQIKSKKGKKKSSGGGYRTEYQKKVHESGMRVRRVIEKASKPMSMATIAEKAKVSESRVNSHINYRNRDKKNPPYSVTKKGLVSLASE